MPNGKLSVFFASHNGFRKISMRSYGIEALLKPSYFDEGKLEISFLEVEEGSKELKGLIMLQLEDYDAYVTGLFATSYRDGMIPITMGSAVDEGIHVSVELSLEAAEKFVEQLQEAIAQTKKAVKEKK